MRSRFRWTGKGGASFFRRAGASSKFQPQLLHDLWMAGVKPSEIAAAYWGYLASGRFRNAGLGVLGFIALNFAGAGFMAATGAPFKGRLDAVDVGAYSALIAAYVQTAVFHHHWMVLGMASLALKRERDQWEWRASPMGKVARLTLETLIGCGWVGLVLALGGALIAFLATFFPIGDYARAAVLALKPIGLFIARAGKLFPARVEPVFWGVLIGSALAGMGGAWARISARKTFATAVKHAEAIFKFWQEIGESKPAAAPPGR